MISLPALAAEDPSRSNWSNLMLRIGWQKAQTEADPFAEAPGERSADQIEWRGAPSDVGEMRAYVESGQNNSKTEIQGSQVAYDVLSIGLCSGPKQPILQLGHRLAVDLR